jgi:hypothetical protein
MRIACIPRCIPGISPRKETDAGSPLPLTRAADLRPSGCSAQFARYRLSEFSSETPLAPDENGDGFIPVALSLASSALSLLRRHKAAPPHALPGDYLSVVAEIRTTGNDFSSGDSGR